MVPQHKKKNHHAIPTVRLLKEYNGIPILNSILNQLYLFLNSKIGIILQHFIDQQTYYITNLVNEPTKNHWDKLDPEIQYHIDFIKNETVTTLRY